MFSSWVRPMGLKYDGLLVYKVYFGSGSSKNTKGVFNFGVTYSENPPGRVVWTGKTQDPVNRELTLVWCTCLCSSLTYWTLKVTSPK